MINEDCLTSAELIIKEARSRGIQADTIIKNKIYRLGLSGHIEYTHVICSSKTDSAAHFICKDKNLAKVFLAKDGLRVAEGEVFNGTQIEESINYCTARNLWPVVMKPLNGDCGKKVFANITNKYELREVWQKIVCDEDEILVEKHFEGAECRVLVTRNKILAALNRVPANVTGDGTMTISELIEQKNSDPRRSDKHNSPFVKIKADRAMLLKLEGEGLNVDSIPKKDELIYLRNNSNISTGGDSYDITEEIHPSMGEIALKAINAIPGLAYAGVDIISRDYKSEQNSDSYIIIEINANPGIDMHHFPYSGKPRNVAKGIVDVIFPETKKD